MGVLMMIFFFLYFGVVFVDEVFVVLKLFLWWCWNCVVFVVLFVFVLFIVVVVGW